MFFQIACPSCGKSLKVREDQSGRRCGCPHCKAAVQIPSLSLVGGSLNPAGEKKPGIQIDTKNARRKEVSASAPTSNSTFEDSTNASTLWSFIIGLSTTVLFYLLLFPIHQMGWTEIFWNRGWVPYVTVLLTLWAFAILFLKWRKIKKQRAVMMLDVLPTELSQEITLDSIDKFLNHIAGLPIEGQSFLINRVVRGIEHFRVRKSAPETVTMMESQSDIDANNVLGSYTLVKVFIWALPIMGFIGTVIGVSSAIAGLAGSLENASDVNAIKGALNDVFAGLGTAFDTTLLALVLSLIVKVPCSALQKSEDDLITWVDEYCNENLLKRLDDKREGGAQRGEGTSGVDPAVIRDVFTAAMGVYHEEWNKQVVAMNQATSSLQQSFAAITANTDKLQVDALKSSKALQQHFAGLERGLAGLADVLQKLGQEQVIIQQNNRKRGWFG